MRASWVSRRPGRRRIRDRPSEPPPRSGTVRLPLAVSGGRSASLAKFRLQSPPSSMSPLPNSYRISLSRQ